MLHETQENDYGNADAPAVSDYMGRDMERHYEDDELDALERAADEAQAEAAMADADAYDDAAELDEAIRIAREEADAAEAEYDRLVAYRTRRETTEARLAQGAVAVMNDFTSMLSRRAV